PVLAEHGTTEWVDLAERDRLPTDVASRQSESADAAEKVKVSHSIRVLMGRISNSNRQRAELDGLDRDRHLRPEMVVHADLVHPRDTLVLQERNPVGWSLTLFADLLQGFTH